VWQAIQATLQQSVWQSFLSERRKNFCGALLYITVQDEAVVCSCTSLLTKQRQPDKATPAPLPGISSLQYHHAHLHLGQPIAVAAYYVVANHA
jgi:hypothetical protein